jgi:hypothetical protein
MRFVGFHEDDQLPIKKGHVVTIKKGTVIHSMHPDPAKKRRVAGRTYKVTVDHVLNGRSSTDHVWNEETRKYDEVRTPIDNPSVRWPGESGYWCEVDINQIPEALL